MIFPPSSTYVDFTVESLDETDEDPAHALSNHQLNQNQWESPISPVSDTKERYSGGESKQGHSPTGSTLDGTPVRL
jgi:hypothetical protein